MSGRHYREVRAEVARRPAPQREAIFRSALVGGAGVGPEDRALAEEWQRVSKAAFDRVSLLGALPLSTLAAAGGTARSGAELPIILPMLVTIAVVVPLWFLLRHALFVGPSARPRRPGSNS